MAPTEVSSLLNRSDGGSLSEEKKKPLTIIILASIGIVIVGCLSLTALHYRHNTPSNMDNNNIMSMSLYGSKHDTKKKSYNYKGEFPSTECEEDINYSKHTLKRAYDLPFSALFSNTRGQTNFEASDVTIVNDTVYAVCDSSFAISKFTRNLDPFSDDNEQIGEPSRHGSYESGYEAIFEFKNLFYVVRESIDHNSVDHTHTTTRRNLKKGKKEKVRGEKKDTTTTPSADYHAIIEELSLTDDNYTLVRECRCEFAFEGASKGFEGAIGFPDANGELHILALCEGNHCSNDKKIKKDVGNGRVVIMKKKIKNNDPSENTTPTDDEEQDCVWETVKIAKIPKSAAFLDYSAIDITSTGKVVISSQEESAVWLGHASGVVDGIIDPVTFDFVESSNTKSSSVLSFPKDTGCHTVYCNIEGIHFIDDQMLMAVSDKMKSGGKQDYRCQEKDQSIHTFVIP